MKRPRPSPSQSPADESERIRARTYLGNRRIYSIGNELHFTGNIDSDSIEDAIKELSVIINESRGKDGIKITYVVDSVGGSVTDVLKFVDFIRIQQKNGVHFTSVLTGLVASSGTIMCVVADKRIMTKYAHAMIHELLSSTGLMSYTKIQSHNRFIKTMHNDLVTIYLEHNPSKTKHELLGLLRKDTWFTATEYLDHGFVDEIL